MRWAVGVVVLRVDPDAERAAEASLLRSCQETDMHSLALRVVLELRHVHLQTLPESFGQLCPFQELHTQYIVIQPSKQLQHTTI